MTQHLVQYYIKPSTNHYVNVYMTGIHFWTEILILEQSNVLNLLILSTVEVNQIFQMQDFSWRVQTKLWVKTL